MTEVFERYAETRAAARNAERRAALVLKSSSVHLSLEAAGILVMLNSFSKRRRTEIQAEVGESTTYHLRELENERCIKRDKDPDDARQVRIQITDQGRFVVQLLREAEAEVRKRDML